MKPLTDEELEECRKIGPSTLIHDVRIGSPSVVVQRLIATIDDLQLQLDLAWDEISHPR